MFALGIQSAGAQVFDDVDAVPDELAAKPALKDPWSVSFDATSNEQVYGPSELIEGSELKELNVDVQLRTRGEYRNGWGTLRSKGANPAWFVNERARLNLNYRQQYLSVRVSAQHAGVWGDTDIENKSGSINLNEAWARVQSKQGLFVQAGRQIISYDDERIFGAEDWTSTGISHDAVRFGLDTRLHKVHGIVSFSQTSEKSMGGTYYNGPVPYKHMQALWYHFGDDSTPFQASLLGVNQGVENSLLATQPSTIYTQTVGGWLQYRPGKFYVKGEGYYQMGEDETDHRVNAYTAAFHAGFQPKSWGVEVGADYLSGATEKGEKTRNFTMLYGSTHDFFGAMDYFTNENKLLCGLLDVNMKANWRPNRNLFIDLGYHYLMTGVKVPGLHRQMGNEVDLHLAWEMTKDATLHAGYSVMMATSVMRMLKGGQNKSWQDWAWVSLEVSPRILTQFFRR